MGDRYKIGDISKLLGIPVQTLRFYEGKGILNPKKDEHTGYRYYDAWDLNSLFDTVHYRALEFTINQTEHILNSHDQTQICDLYTEQEMLILNKIEHYQAILQVISRQRQQMQIFENSIGVFRRCKSPGLIFHRHRLMGTFQTVGGTQDFRELGAEIEMWVKMMPSVTPTFLIPYTSLDEEDESVLQYWWGWSIPASEAIQRGVNTTSPNEFLPASKCLYTVFEAGGKHTFATSFYHQVYQAVLEKEYVINGNPFGRLIVKTHEGENYRRYFEVWIPIE